MEGKKFQKVPKSSKIFRCEICDYSSVRKSQYERHLLTKKHKSNEILTFPNKILTNPNIENVFGCLCGKSYKHRSTLSNHKKTCPLKSAESSTGEAAVQPVYTEAEFQTKLITILKDVLPHMAINNITNNNQRISNNQINIFLNEKCGDAMSIQQFAKRLTFTIDEIMMEKQDALVSVINKNLNPLKETERPVHCTNVARRKWHVKDESEGWKQDDGTALVKSVSNIMLRKGPNQFAETYPDYVTNSNRKEEYIKIVQMASKDIEPKVEGRVLTMVGENNQLDIQGKSQTL